MATDPRNPAPAKRPSRWHRPMWWLNVVAGVVLLVTYLAPHISPVTFWIPALLAMTFVFQLVVHLGFLLWWWMFRRKRMLLSGVLLVLGYGHIGDHVQILGRSAPEQPLASEAVKVMSYNVRLFDLYNWSHNERTRDGIFEQFQREKADILCLQEFFHSPNKRFFHTRKALLNDLHYSQVHERYSHKAKYDQHFGIATFSTWPMVAKGHIEFPGNTHNLCIWTDLAVKDDTLRVYNAHLASYHFGDADYKFLQDLDTDTHTDSLKQGGERILKRLLRGFHLRVDEVQRIADHMRQSPHPVVYCGDMNDVPMSHGYGRLREQLDDAFVESGRGLGGTYIGDLPSLRIDHILISPELQAWDFHTLPEKLSDHRAITAMIGVRGK